jgi:hypothetical protein
MNLKDLKERRLTQSGKKSGVAEFIMQEEFDRYTGYWWNQKNENEYQIAYLEVDESEVPLLKISEPGRSRECEEYKYPRPGDKNAKSILKIINLKDDKFEINPFDIDCDWCEYIARYF